MSATPATTAATTAPEAAPAPAQEAPKAFEIATSELHKETYICSCGLSSKMPYCDGSVSIIKCY